MLAGSCGPDLPTPAPEQLFVFGEGSISYSAHSREISIIVPLQTLNGIDSVQAVVRGPSSGDSTISVLLNDSGAQGDLVAGDQIYSCSYIYSFSDSSTGTLRANVRAWDLQGNLSDAYALSVPFSVVNHPPVILKIDTPDTMVLPVSGTKLLTLKAWVDDPDGVEDIVSLTYEIFRLSDSTWISNTAFQLSDVDPANENMLRDGYFTSTVSISSTNSPVLNTFRYTAKDAYGNFSESVLDSIRMVRPSKGDGEVNP